MADRSYRQMPNGRSRVAVDDIRTSRRGARVLVPTRFSRQARRGRPRSDCGESSEPPVGKTSSALADLVRFTNTVVVHGPSAYFP